jgi:molybdopterin/thiamine biosynthesis adenylyltransferase/rhodanese-related sulfurtransferase
MNDRYSRQTLVSKIGLKGQLKIEQTNVLIVGAGGLGCTVAAQLAGAGIGGITIIDHDIVDRSNLHRQILFREDDVDQSKAVIAARELTRINNSCQITPIKQRLNTKNVNHLVESADLVVDAADNFATAYLLSDACVLAKRALISASVNRTFGYVGQFCASGPSLRAVFPRLPMAQASCNTVGVTGPSVGVVASIQAQEVIKFCVGDPSQLSGKLLYLDVWDYTQQLIDFNGIPEPTTVVLKLLGPETLSTGALVLDVRSAAEVVTEPHDFVNQRNIPLGELAAFADQLGKDTEIVCACASGQRAITAGQQLLNLGFLDVSALIPN